MQRMHAALAAGPLLAVGSFLALSVAVPAFSADSAASSGPASDAGLASSRPRAPLGPPRTASAAHLAVAPTPVPEPSTGLLLALGLVALAARRGRRGGVLLARAALVAGTVVPIFGATPAAALNERAEEACAFWAASDGAARKQMMQRYAQQMAQADRQLASCIYLQWDRFTAALDRACFDGSDLDRSLARVYTELSGSGSCE